MKFDSKRVNIIFFRHPRAGDLHWIRVSAVADAGQIQMAGIEMSHLAVPVPYSQIVVWLSIHS